VRACVCVLKCVFVITIINQTTHNFRLQTNIKELSVAFTLYLILIHMSLTILF